MYETSDDFDKMIGTFCGRELNGKRVFSNFETLFLIFVTDSLVNNVGFLMHLDFRDTIDPTEHDIVIDIETFLVKKRAFRGEFSSFFCKSIFLYENFFIKK